MSILEKLNFLLSNNAIQGEDNLEIWCDGTWRALKMLDPIKDCFEQNVPKE